MRIIQQDPGRLFQGLSAWVRGPIMGIIEKSKIELQKQEDDDDNPIDSHLESQYEERFLN